MRPTPVPAACPHPCSRRPPGVRQDVSVAVASRAIGGRRGWGRAEPLGPLRPPGPQGSVCSIPECGGTGRPCPYRVIAQNAQGDLRPGDLGMSLCLSACHSHRCTHTHTHAHTRTHTYVLTCLRTHTHTCMHTCMYSHTCTHVHNTHAHSRSHTYMYLHTYKHTLAHTHTHMHAHTCTHTHTHIHAHAQAHTSPSAGPLPPVQTPNPQSLGTQRVRMQKGRLWWRGGWRADAWLPGRWSEQGRGPGGPRAGRTGPGAPEDLQGLVPSCAFDAFSSGAVWLCVLMTLGADEPVSLQDDPRPWRPAGLGLSSPHLGQPACPGGLASAQGENVPS